MNNQWGRSGGGPTAGGSGIGNILFASIVSLALGAAGGYGAFRATSGAAPDASEIEQRDRRITDLAGELDARAAQAEQSSLKTQALTDENASLKRQIEALRSNAGASGASAAIAENLRLTQDVVPGLQRDLETVRQRIGDAEALKKRAEEAVLDREKQLSLRADQIARLEQVLDQMRGEQSASRNAETERLEAEADTLRQQLKDASGAADKLRTELPALKAEIAGKDREIATLNARNGALTARITALEIAAQPKGPEKVDDNAARGNGKPADGRSPRNASLVAQAVQNTPGLDRLTGAQRVQLEQTLVSGECVTNALGGVFQRVPVLALRNLMRDLDSDC